MADHGATSSQHFKYDVFLSFRGDTRHAFTDHLYHALINKRINTFRDDQNLGLGHEIGPALVDAIEESRMSIVVLSQEYASSSWCLDELVKIMECSDNGKKRPVFPIFYQVEPRDVRRQKNQYKTAMIVHKKKYGRKSRKVQAWRTALSAVANLSGEHCKDRSESDIIKKIVGEVIKKLPSEPLHIPHPIEFEGMEASESNKKRKRDVEEGDVVGFDDSLSIVINQLKKEDPLRNVVSITGMGGLGKTTLAQKIYNNSEVKKLFPCRAWSFVSKDFSGRNVLLSLLCCLKERLKRKKYLVVLDDIWETEVWDKLNNSFPDNNNGSMILITSRDDAVAHYTRSRHPHHRLPLLNDENSWELFCRKVFGKEECPSELEPIGRSIVERCGGLPLAIITLGGLVAKKERSYEEWSQIKDFVPWYLAEDPAKVMDVLKVSYDNLPEKLKPCFLYFGIYPEDYEILARDLIQLWIAEGFINPERTATSKVPKPEDVGYKYLKELMDRNLIQVAKRRSDGGVKICRIHDLLRELCILESKADNFLEVCTESTINSLSNSCRLSLLCNEQYYTSLIKCSQPSTRSLFFFGGGKDPQSILEYFPLVYVLLVARPARFSKYPCDLSMMFNLKYLRIECLYIEGGIPDWIWSLDNLETLDLRGCESRETMKIWRLERLWHLERLRHLYISFGKLEEANSKPMWNLQTFSEVYVEPQTMLLLNSGSFPNLKKLGLFCGLSSDYLLHQQLWNLHQLSNLRTFKVRGCQRISLDGIVFPSSISKITLTDFDGLDSGCMSALGRITSLRILKLLFGWTATETLNCGAAKGDFPQLQVFHIEGIRIVKRLTVENGAMPRLQRVVIPWCYDLEELPERLLSLCDDPSDWKTASNL